MNSSDKQSDAFEILTTKEVLNRLKIGRTKLFGLMKKGTLTPGRHFFKNGGVLRFVWGIEFISALHENPGEEPVSTKRPPINPTKHERPATGRSPINLNY